MLPTDTSADLAPGLRYRSRPFVRHLILAAVFAALPLAFILLGFGIVRLGDAYPQSFLDELGVKLAIAGACLIPLALLLLLGLLSMVVEFQQLERRERWVLRFTILFFALGLLVSAPLSLMLMR